MSEAIEWYRKYEAKHPSEYRKQILNFARELDSRGFKVRRIITTTGRIMTALPDIGPERIWVRISFLSTDYNIVEVRLYKNSMSFIIST